MISFCLSQGGRQLYLLRGFWWCPSFHICMSTCGNDGPRIDTFIVQVRKRILNSPVVDVANINLWYNYIHCFVCNVWEENWTVCVIFAKQIRIYLCCKVIHSLTHTHTWNSESGFFSIDDCCSICVFSATRVPNHSARMTSPNVPDPSRRTFRISHAGMI